jgi:thiamine-phosphate pyrophosphorylase
MLKRFSTLVAGLSKPKHTFPIRALPKLWVMTDVVRLPDPSPIIAQLPVNSAVVIRHPDAKIRRALAVRVHSLCKARRVKLLISDDWRSVAALGADGVHLPERSTTYMSAGLRLFHRSKRIIVTAASHSERVIHKAYVAKCDAVFVSPVLPTQSHPTTRALGRVRYAQWARGAQMPVIALGGITFNTLRSLNDTCTSGVAGISFTEKSD